MRHIVLKLIVFFLAGLGLLELQGQSMYVKEIVGTQTAYSLSEISKMSFTSGKLSISMVDSSIAVYSLDSLSYLTFADSTWVSNGPESILDHSIKAYPNPVRSTLTIDLSDASFSDGTLQILSVEGRIMQTHEIKDSGIVSVDMGQLPRGIYICRFSSETELESFKIIKL